MKNKFLQTFIEIILVCLITVAFCSFAPTYILAVALLPVLYIYLALKRGVFAVTVAYVISITLLAFAIHFTFAAMAAILILPPIWIISHLQLRGSFSINSVLIACGSYFMGILIIIAAVYAISGQDVVTYVLGYIKSAFLSAPKGTLGYRALITFGHFNSLSDITLDNIASESFVNILNGIKDIDKIEYTNRAIDQLSIYLGPTIASFSLIYSMAGGFFTYLLSNKLSVKRGANIKKIKPFQDWYVNRKFGLAALGMMAAAFAAAYIDGSRFSMALSMVTDLVLMVYYIHGCSTMVFIFSRRGNAGMAITMIVVLTLFFTAGFVIAMALFGAFEHILKIKQRLKEHPKNPTG